MKQGRLRLGALRANRQPKLSQSQVARQAGMGLHRYWQIENGEGPASTADERKAVAAALDVKTVDIEWPEHLVVKAS